MRPEGKAPASSAVAIRLPAWAYPLVTLGGLLLGIEAIVRGTRAVVSICDSDLTNFFLKSASYVLAGDPFHMYAVRDSCTLGNTYPNYNPPLSNLLLAPFLELARALGFTNNNGELITIVSLPFIVVVPILGFLMVRVLRRLYPEIPETQLFLAYLLILLSPLTWQTYGTWYHVEQPIMLCLLILAIFTLQARREVLAGVFAGLAMLTRTTALMPLVAIGILLLMAREWRTLLRFAGVAAGIVLVGFAPFFIFAPRDTIYSLVQWRGTAIIGSDSIWTIFAYDGSDTSSIRYLIDAAARRMDAYVVLLFIAAATFLIARRMRITAYDRDAWAVVAVAMLAVPLLSKTVWPYYYLEPFVALLIWEFASMHDRRAGVWRWPVLSVGFLAVAATLSQYIGLRSVGAVDRIGLGLLQFAAMGVFVVAVWMRLPAIKVATAPRLARADAASPAVARPDVPRPNASKPALQRGLERALTAARAPAPDMSASALSRSPLAAFAPKLTDMGRRRKAAPPPAASIPAVPPPVAQAPVQQPVVPPLQPAQQSPAPSFPMAPPPPAATVPRSVKPPVAPAPIMPAMPSPQPPIVQPPAEQPGGPTPLWPPEPPSSSSSGRWNGSPSESRNNEPAPDGGDGKPNGWPNLWPGPNQQR